MPSERIKMRAACKRRMGVGCKFLEAEGVGDVHGDATYGTKFIFSETVYLQ